MSSKQSSKKTKPPLSRGKWEVTLRNLRALKKRLTALERRMQSLERMVFPLDR